MREIRRVFKFLAQLKAGDSFHVMLKSEAEVLERLEYIIWDDKAYVLLNSKNIKVLMDAGYKEIDRYVIDKGLMED